MLTIENYDKITNANISCMGQRWKVATIEESENWYEIAFLPQIDGVFSIHQAHFVKVFRQVEDNGFEYLTDSFFEGPYASRGLNKIHKQYLKDPKDLVNWIGSHYLVRINIC
jgi:hypothetical protein